MPKLSPPFALGSPVSDDGRGLKQHVAEPGHGLVDGSPVSDDGRGLKRLDAQVLRGARDGSPVSDDGRGLKPCAHRQRPRLGRVRPSVMTGVD